MRKYTLLFLFFFQVTWGFGQTKSQPNSTWQTTFFNSPNTILPLLIDAALTHSAALEINDAEKEIANKNILLARKKLMNGLALNTGYGYGTMLNYIDGAQEVNQINAFNLPARAQYNVGLRFTLSLGELGSRRHEIGKEQLLLKQAEAARKVGEKEVRKIVIEQYQRILLAKTELEHYQDALQTASVNKQIANKRFTEGDLQVDEQMAALDFHSKASLAVTQAKNKYQTELYLLEEIIGMPIQNLIKTP
ncbi:hypothetical protein EFA69_00680 [Rufibacter immobilis]|uniref:TolC family protein n=1 Tax=Rufibacter immobilis TaxID=1348778 RepID=A0A3M9N5A5_9BACT|nr:TolC family protein [Rufibacter immobilis]RNI32972.1 hypothetical protein EFA69_00680 [Rufibacter immobilis]